VPPRFATVTVSETGDFAADGPLSEEQLQVQLAQGGDAADQGPFSDEEQKIMSADPWGYEVDMTDMQVTGDYPGGCDRAALNLARFVLGG
jgi:hypothetical protein